MKINPIALIVLLLMSAGVGFLVGGNITKHVQWDHAAREKAMIVNYLDGVMHAEDQVNLAFAAAPERRNAVIDEMHDVVQFIGLANSELHKEYDLIIGQLQRSGSPEDQELLDFFLEGAVHTAKKMNLLHQTALDIVQNPSILDRGNSNQGQPPGGVNYNPPPPANAGWGSPDPVIGARERAMERANQAARNRAEASPQPNQGNWQQHAAPGQNQYSQ